MNNFTKSNWPNIRKLRFISFCMITCFFTFVSSIVLAQQVRLINAEFVSLSGQGVEIRMQFDNPPSTPNSYVIESPPRLVMDFTNVTNGIGANSLSVNSGIVDSVNFAQAPDRFRIVTNLRGTASHDVQLDGNLLTVRLQDSASVMPPTAVSPASTTSAPVQASAPVQSAAPVSDGRTHIRSIDFQRIDGNVGRVIIDMTNDRAAMDINREGGNIVLNLAGAVIGNDLARRLDVQDFATPLLFIDSMSNAKGTTILMRPSQDPFDYMAYQTGNQLIVDFKPITREDRQAQANQFPFTGERIDLNFQNVDVRAVLQIIAEVAEMNLVVSDSVTGTSTLRLKSVPWDQALDILLKSKGLDKREVGNVLMIGTAAEIAERERIEAASQIQVQELAPLLTEFIQVDFRRASDMREQILAANLLSDRGFLLADDQTNILMVRDTSKNITEIRGTLSRFDKEVPQILVEARIIEATASSVKELGLRWNAQRNGSINGNSLNIGGGLSSDGSMVDLGITGIPTSALAIGFASSSAVLSAQIEALETKGEANIISQPKVLTTNGNQAVISSGQKVPYVIIEDGTRSVQLEDVVLELKVTPQINPGDRISLEIEIKKDDIAGAAPNGELILSQNLLTTSITLLDGDTVVLGGVFLNSERVDTSKVPLLGDLPVVGGLFRSTLNSSTKNELLIFITPTMIRESLAIQ